MRALHAADIAVVGAIADFVRQQEFKEFRIGEFFTDGLLDAHIQ